jgi:hypothetical protein
MPKSALPKVPRKRQVHLEFRAPPKAVLEAQWQAAFGRPLPLKMRRPLAVLLLRFHEQETSHGGLSLEVEAYLASLLPKARGSGSQAAPTPVRRLKPGTRLLRAWHGTTPTPSRSPIRASSTKAGRIAAYRWLRGRSRGHPGLARYSLD